MWTRKETVEDTFEALHGFKPEVYIDRTERCLNRVKLISGAKTVFLTELLERGMTKHVDLKYDTEALRFSQVYDAEKKAVEILRGA
jgi:hypothetical protein